MTTDEHFEAALKGDGSTDEAARNAAQQAHAEGRMVSQSEKAAREKTPVLPGNATDCDAVHRCLVPPEGLEPSTL